MLQLLKFPTTKIHLTRGGGQGTETNKINRNLLKEKEELNKRSLSGNSRFHPKTP